MASASIPELEHSLRFSHHKPFQLRNNNHDLRRITRAPPPTDHQGMALASVGARRPASAGRQRVQCARSSVAQPVSYLPLVMRSHYRIAFISYRDGNGEIYMMNADGSGQTRLTSGSRVYLDNLAWSPDGRRVAFVSGRDGNAEIYVMNADGSGQTRLTNNSAGNTTPVWSPRP